MRSGPRTAALLAGAVAVLVAPLAVLKAWSDPATPRISVGAAPAATLVPGDVRDATGRMVAAAVWTGLVAHDPGTGATAQAAAESITSPDRRVWTVRLRPGGRFHDGTPVTARSFTGAWTAVLNEGWYGARLLGEVARVKGAGAARTTGAGGAKDVEGLKVKDERTFEVTLDRPLNGFPALLSDPAFFPMPESVLRSRDWPSYARLPIGNGPLRVRSHDGRETVLQRPAGGREIVVKAMPDAARQYAAAEAGDLDLATAVPPGRHGSMDGDFPRRHLAVPGRTMTYLAFPAWIERLSSPALRQAMSMAIDRRAVTEGPLGHQASPADSLVPPGILPGRRQGQCRRCVHDPRAAVGALTDTGGLTGPVTIWHETSAGDEQWVKAVAEQLRKELRLDVRTRALPPADLRRALDDRKVDGPFVVHSSAAYPAPIAAVAPLLETGGDGYVSGLVDEAERAATPEDAVTPARLAETALLRDMPAMPLWSAHEHLVWTERLRGVTAGAFTGPRLDRLTIRD